MFLTPQHAETPQSVTTTTTQVQGAASIISQVPQVPSQVPPLVTLKKVANLPREVVQLCAGDAVDTNCTAEHGEQPPR